MAKSIGTLSAKAVLDANGFTAGAAQVEAKAKTMGTRLEQIFGKVSAGVRLGSGFFLGFENVTTGALVQAAKTTFGRVQEVMEGEINIGFLNDQLGTSIEWLTTMRTVAGENSVGADQFSQAMNRLHQTMGSAANGGTEAQRIFNDLGLRWQDIRDQGFEQSFMQIANALGTVGDRAVRARLATEMFGREGGGRMLRFMNQGLGDAAADVQGRGGFTSEEDMRRFQEMNSAIDRMSTSWSNMWREFSATVAPAIARATNEITDVVRGIGDIRQFISGEARGINTALPAYTATGTAASMQAASERLNEANRRQIAAAEAQTRAADAVAPPGWAQMFPGGAAAFRFGRDTGTGPEGARLRQLRDADAGLAVANRAVQVARAQVEAEQAAMAGVSVAGGVFDRQLRELREQLIGTSSAAGLSGDALALHRMRLAANSDAQRAAVAQLESDVTARRRAEAEMTNLMRLQDLANTPVDRLRSRIGEIQGAGDFMTNRQRGAALANVLGNLDAGPQQLLGNLGIGGSDTAAILQGAASPQIDRLTQINTTLEAMLAQARATEEIWDTLGDSLDDIAARLPAFTE